MDAQEQFRRYEEQMGSRAAERQASLARKAAACTCGKMDAPVADHHPGCKVRALSWVRKP